MPPSGANAGKPFNLNPKGRGSMMLQTNFDRARLLNEGVILLRRCLPSNLVIRLHQAAEQVFSQRLAPDGSLPTAEYRAEARKLSFVAVSDLIGAPPNLHLSTVVFWRLPVHILGTSQQLSRIVLCGVWRRGRMFRRSHSTKIRRSCVGLCLTFGRLSTPAASLLRASKWSVSTVPICLIPVVMPQR